MKPTLLGGGEKAESESTLVGNEFCPPPTRLEFKKKEIKEAPKASPLL